MEDRTDLLREASWDQERLKDLPLDEGSGVAAEETRRIIGSIAPDLQRLVKAKQLTPYLPKRDIASSEAEYQELTKENSTECERAQCLRDILFAAGRCSRPRAFLRNLYLALLDSFENDSGLANHRYLAVNCLREQVLHVQGIDRQEHANKQKDLPTIAKNLTPVSISRNDALALRQKLGLESEAASESTECVGRICEEWLQKVSQCSLVRLVKALLCVPGLGRLVSQLVPLCFCNTRKVYNFVRCLQQHWQQLALYLGYSQEEVDAIVEHCPPDDVNSQIKMFLRLWWMPDCGTRTQAILDELKACAGITSAPDTQIYCPHKTKGRDGGDERTDVVPSNVVNFYQSFYCLPPGSTVQGAVHGAIAGAGVCAQHPQGGVAFNPATGFGVPAIPFSPWPAACTQPLPPTAHTVPTEQANVQILPESSNQLVTETKDTPPQTSSKIVTVEQPVTEVPPLAEDSALLPRHSGLEPEEQQPKVDNEMCEPTVDHTTVHNAVRDESRNEGAALLAACMNSEWDMGKALVNSGSFLEARSHDGKTPLLHTCIKGEVAFVKYLVKEHADITAQDSQGHCCLHFREVLQNEALMTYLLPIFTLLAISIDIPDENKCTPLLAACNLGDTVAHSVHLLLHHEANPDGNNHAQCRPLVEASAHGHERTVKLLLQYNANPDIQDVRGCTALLKACNCRQSKIICLLLEHGVSVNRSDHDGTTPLFSAVSSNAREVVRQLIQKGAHINITRYRTNPMMSGAVEETPLAQACARGFLEIVELLILYGADVNYLCSGTVPPLGFAIIGNQMHIVKYLLENSDVNKSLRGLRAPIVIAVKVQNIACAKLMITELGGEEKALMMARQQNMYQLAEHIELYMALRKDIPDSVLEEMGDYNPVQAHVQDPTYYKTGEVMQSFSEVCVAAVISVVTREGTASVITDQHRCAGEFLNRCINGTQCSEMLRSDLMSGDPSPFKFFIDNRLLTTDNFQIQAFERYGDHASKFCDELVETFRQLPGGESLSNDINIILMRLFSGQLGIGCLTTSSRSGRDSLPQELLPWYDSKYRSSMRQSQPSPIPKSALKSEEHPVRCSPSIPQVQSTAASAESSVPVPHHRSRHSANQGREKQSAAVPSGKQSPLLAANNSPKSLKTPSTVAGISTPQSVAVASCSESEVKRNMSRKGETVNQDKGACQPSSVFQQSININQHPTVSHPASTTSSATFTNFQSSHSTPSQGHLFAHESYHSSRSNSPIQSPPFASTPVPESAHEPRGECVRPRPQTRQQRRSDSAYVSDQSLQETLEPEGPIYGDEVQQSHCSAEMYEDESGSQTPQRHSTLYGSALEQNIPVLFAPPGHDMDIGGLIRHAGGRLLVIPSSGTAEQVSRSDSCPENIRRPNSLSMSTRAGRSQSFPWDSNGSRSSFHCRTDTSGRGTEEQSVQGSSKTISGNRTE